MSVELIQARVTEAFAPIDLKVEALDANSGKFSVYVVSAAFDGKGLLQRHRAVNGLFKEEMASNAIHALTLNTKTPSEVAPPAEEKKEEEAKKE